MASKLFGSKSSATEAPALAPVEKPVEKGELTYHRTDKFLASFFSFGIEAPKEKGRRLVASMIARNSKFATMDNANEILRVLLPDGFVADAKANGWSLTEAVKHATDIIEAQKASKKESRRGAVSRALDAVAADMQLGRLTRHRLRASFATMLHQQGKNIKIIQKLMRHKRVETTMSWPAPEICTT